MDELIPKNRVITDTRKLVVYYRASPDRKRILFGGRVSLNETDPQKSAPALHQQLVTIFPQLASTQVSHSWMGFVGYTFDEMPHTRRKRRDILFNGLLRIRGFPLELFRNQTRTTDCRVARR